MIVRAILAAAAATVLAAAQPVTLDHEPRHHLLFENEALRIISPQIPAGDTTLEHMHTRDEVTVCIQGSTTRAKPHDGEWGAVGTVCAPGRANINEYTGSARAHTVQNVGDKTYHLMLVENERESGWTEFPAVEIGGAKMLGESIAARVYEAQSSEPPHVHRVPVVVVLVSGDVTVGAKHLDHRGGWALLPAGDAHHVEAHGDSHYLEIEVR